jgi:hypothetical protein
VLYQHIFLPIIGLLLGDGWLEKGKKNSITIFSSINVI